jgi:hypothetical protein
MPVQDTSRQDSAHQHRGYGDRNASAAYVGYSVWQFDALIRQGVLPRGVALTPNAKLIWSYAKLDAAIECAGRSRQPRRELRGAALLKSKAKQRRKSG